MTAQQSSPFDVLLVQCRDLVGTRLSESVKAMLDKASESLTAIVAKTTDQEEKKTLLAARDIASSQRGVIEAQFEKRFRREFQERTNLAKKIGQSLAEIDLSSMELELVAEEDFNETLKFNEISAKLNRYCAEELSALDQRVGVLLGDATLTPENNPLSPAAICDAYKQACRSADSNVAVRMVLLRLFDDHVMDDVRSIYKAVNELLVENAILPKIRYGVSRKDGGKAAPQDAAPTESPNDAPAMTEGDLFAALQKIISQGAPGGGAGGAGGGPTLQGPELLSSLTRIQLGDVSGIPGAEALVAAANKGGATNILHDLKSSSVGAVMSHMDSMTLDIVALLFDQIFDDPKIPVAVKGLAARLQIPMLKVAIADKTFFSKKNHPARQLLDALGEMAMRLPSDFSPANPLYEPLAALIQELVDGFQEKMEIFGSVRERLQALIAEQDRQVAIRMQGEAKALDQSEKLALARAVGRDAIKARIKSPIPPRPVLEFLAQRWIKYLVVVHARDGVESDAWKNALTTVEKLVWSVTTKSTMEERRMLASTVPALLKSVKAGIAAAGEPDQVCMAFFKDLMRCHTAAIQGAPKPAVAVPAARVPDTKPAGVAAKAGIVAGVNVAVGKDVKAAVGAGAAVTVSAGPAAPTVAPAKAAPVSKPPTAESKPAASGVPAAAVEQSAGSAPRPRDLEPPPPAGSEDDLDFTDPLTIKNPFGAGEVKVDDLDFTTLVGAPQPTAAHGAKGPGQQPPARKPLPLPNNLVLGCWVSIPEHGNTGQAIHARLHHVSPMESHFLFVDHKGKKAYECSRAMLSMRLKAGQIKILNSDPNPPLFDQLMGGVFKKLGKPVPA